MGQTWNEILSGYELTQRNDNYELMLHNPATNTTYRITAGNFITGLERIIGEVRIYCGTSAPNGWLTCNGTEVSRTTYADLFSVIGTTFGVGDGSTTFNLPDFQGRSPVGVGSGSGLTARAMGDSDGEEEHTLNAAEMPNHAHGFTAFGDLLAGAGTDIWRPTTAGSTITSSAVGGGNPHNTMHPFLAINLIIYSGVFA